MQLLIERGGSVRCLYGETIDLAALGSLEIRRGSHVEPDPQGRWMVDLAPVRGPKLGPFKQRSDAVKAEQAWLEAHWLTPLQNNTASKQQPNVLIHTTTKDS